MKTPSRLSLFFFLVLSFDISGQNLVKNPDFELVERLPREGMCTVGCTKYWRSPTFGTPDYYHKDSKGKFSTNRNFFGSQIPHSGKAYAAILICPYEVEYIATILADTLIKGENYLVEFYISRAEKSKNSINEFGVLFTSKINMSINQEGIAEKPSVDFTNPDGYKNKKDWVKLSAIYQAAGFETTLILGYFNYDRPQGYKGSCYYYIDDVSVTPIESKSASALKTEIADSISQPFLPKFGVSVALKNIFFTSNESELLSESSLELDKLVQYLKKDINTTIVINGYTDNTGNEDKNKTLSDARAKAVAKYLILKGIDKTRIKYAGNGSESPIATNDTEQGRQLNRRVEFTINKK